MTLFDFSGPEHPANSSTGDLTDTPEGAPTGGPLTDAHSRSEPTVHTGPPDLQIFIPGHPAAQGSKRGFVHRNTGRVVMVEQSKRVTPWRHDVRDALTIDGQPRMRFDCAVHIGLEFVMPRPKSLPKSRTPKHTKRPDGDKLTRAMFDAITSAGVWPDDSWVTHFNVDKRYAEPGEPPGCHLVIREDR